MALPIKRLDGGYFDQSGNLSSVCVPQYEVSSRAGLTAGYLDNRQGYDHQE